MKKLSDDNLRNLFNLSKENQSFLDNLKKPLEAFFGIKQFSYYHIKNDGQMVLLNSSPNCLAEYLKNEYYLIDPHIVHPDNIQAGKSLWINIDDVSFQGKYIFSLRNHYLLDHGLSCITKADSSYQAFTFTTHINNFAIYDKYFNHQDFIDLFVKKFDCKLFKGIDSNYVNMKNVKQDLFYSQQGIINEKYSITGKLNIN